MKDLSLVVLSGPSGAGKSTAVKALEDTGYFCVDNMPAAMLPKFMELVSQAREIVRVAAVVDVRERGFLKEFLPAFESIRAAGYSAALIYLEATDEALVKRFSETRRRHPLSGADSPIEGILSERKLLEDLKARADKVIDTTDYNVHQLRALIKDLFSGPITLEKITVNLVSFGFRYGIPTDADLVMDVRFLPNPYFVDSLKGLDGTSEKVIDFVLSKAETKEFLSRLKDFLSYLIPLYWKEGKAYLTVAIGCTGGKHRSVVIADELAGVLSSDKAVMRTMHRDRGKP
ncbi:MAG: RNase adapter RapZ [Thermodesulfobacteriota bacterium]|nr:MAG: RNase adapter RapZ [Thermodesulfobacteriota bacterium]